MERFEYVDFAKGYAIFTVVLFHLLQHAALTPLWSQAIVFGGSGIHLFFLLSGFGLAYSRSATGFMDFYRRRFTRVWLPYVLALTLSLIAAFAFNWFPDRLQAWLAGVLLYQMFIERFIESFGGHFWFISAIFQFYLLFPLLRLARQRLSIQLFFLLAFVLSLAWWLLVYFLDKGSFRTWNGFFLQYLWEFALGMSLAAAVSGPQSSRVKFWNYPVVLITLAALIFTGLMVALILKFGAVGKIFNDIPALLGYTAFSVLVYQLSNSYIPAIKRFFLWINSFSFSLYLVHILVLNGYLAVLQLFSLPVSVVTLAFFLPFALLLGRGFEIVSSKWVNLWTR